MKSLVWPKTAFWVFMALLFLSSNVQETIFFRPQSVHVWRQADCASQSLNFHQNKVSFWTPQVHNHAGTNGYAASEFPIIYYVVAKCYDLFGFHEFWHRAATLLVAILGWWCLFLFCARLYENGWVALFPVAFLATSPYYFFYANNFLPNVPAISLALAGWYCFLRYWRSAENKWLWLWGLTFLLSNLLKVSEGISFITTICLFGLLFVRKSVFKGDVPPKVNLPLLAGVSTAVIGLTAWWYLYVRAFNATHGNTGSLLGIYPIWIMTEQDWSLTKYMVFDVWWTHYHDPLILRLLLGLGVLFILFWRRLDPLLKWATTIVALGVAAYSLLWFKAFGMHDYYTLTQVIFPLFLVITLAEFGWRAVRGRRLATVAFSVLLIAIAAIGFENNSRVQHDRYGDPKYGSVLPRSLHRIEPYLDSIGVKRTDLVVSLPDHSPNISLYLMNRPGHTEAFFGQDFRMDWYQQKGAKYLIINDSSYLKKEQYQPYYQRQIGYYDGVWIFDIRPEE